jgi:hypothetical protein
MKINQYNEMMRYLTRKPTPVTISETLDTSGEQREAFAEGTKKKKTSLTSKVSNQLGMGPTAIADVGEEVISDVKGLYGKYAPQIAKGALTGLKVIGTPAVSAALYAQDVYSDLKDAADQGSVTASKALDAFIGQGEKGLYFMLPELAKDVITSPIASKILQLGSLGRFATPAGLSLSAAGVAKDFYDQYKDFQTLSPEEKEKRIKGSTYTPTEQDFQRMQEAESRASAATGGMVQRENYAFGSLFKQLINQVKGVVGPVAQPTSPTTPEVPLTVQERYNKYLSQPSASNVDLGGGGLSDLFRRLISKFAIATPQTTASTNDSLYNLYRSGVDGKANGGRIGYAEGSDDELEIPLLNNTKRLGPEDRISKYQSYSELELLGNIDAKKPNYEILEDYIYRNMPTYEPKDIVPKGAKPVMPNEYDRRPSDGILELARGGKVKK